MAFWRTCFELPGDGHRRWLAMEGLRGMAVVLVFFVHYTELVSRYFGAPLEGVYKIKYNSGPLLPDNAP